MMKAGPYMHRDVRDGRGRIGTISNFLHYGGSDSQTLEGLWMDESIAVLKALSMQW